MSNYDDRRIRYEFESTDDNRSYRSRRTVQPQKTLDERIQKSRKTMDIILVIMGILIVAFTITMIIIFIKTGGIPDTLVGCFFAAATGEFGVMGWIKSTKDKYLNRDIKKEDKDSTNQPIDENPSYNEGDQCI